MQSNNFTVETGPHIHSKDNTKKVMWLVTLSLLPSGAAGIYIFGLDALWTILLAVFSATITEAIIQKLTNKKISILDGSALLTGLLLAYNLPAHVPFWIPIVGSFTAIAFGKMVFGGLGQNIFNPALVGRAFLMACWPKYITTFTQPMKYDAITSATPLALLKEGKTVEHISYMNLFLGNRAGCLGEVCIIALLIGAAFLFWKKIIRWYIPFTYIITTGLFIFFFGNKQLFTGDWLFHILSGGLILGAFYMATDYVTSPLTIKGQIVFGIGCGLLTGIIRLWGGYPEGVCYSILMMNAATPLIDRFTKNKVYGKK